LHSSTGTHYSETCKVTHYDPNVENPLTGIDEIEQIASPADRAKEIGKRLAGIPGFQARLRQMRQAAILEMRASGMTYGAIAAEIGLHRNRIQQIAEGRTAGGQGGGDKEPSPDKPPTPRKAATRAKKTA
jgi:hypothetical protein